MASQIYEYFNQSLMGLLILWICYLIIANARARRYQYLTAHATILVFALTVLILMLSK